MPTPRGATVARRYLERRAYYPSREEQNGWGTDPKVSTEVEHLLTLVRHFGALTAKHIQAWSFHLPDRRDLTLVRKELRAILSQADSIDRLL